VLSLSGVVVGMEGPETIERQLPDVGLTCEKGESREAEALRTAVLVVGFVLLIPSVVLLVFAVLSVLTFGDYGSNDFRRYVWISYIAAVAGMAAAAVFGYFLVRVARKRLVYSVREVLYPALVIIGAYMMLRATIVVVETTAFMFVRIEIWGWGMAISALYQVPYIIGGLLLAMIGMHKFPRNR
jgi:hypothetical protein